MLEVCEAHFQFCFSTQVWGAAILWFPWALLPLVKFRRRKTGELQLPLLRLTLSLQMTLIPILLRCPSHIPLTPGSQSPCHGPVALPGGVAQTFVSERSEHLLVVRAFSAWGCCTDLLTVGMGQESTRRGPGVSPEFSFPVLLV